MVPVSTLVRGQLRLALLLLAWLPTIALGLSGDRNQPIQIEADSATLDESEGISIYEGNVQLRQGTLELKGTRMTVYLKDNQVEKVVLTGQPASYSQRSDGEDSARHAEADKIDYQPVVQRLILLRNAKIWQHEADEFSSDRIDINLKDNTLSAGGKGPEGRVRIILQPNAGQPEQQAPAP